MISGFFSVFATLWKGRGEDKREEITADKTVEMGEKMVKSEKAKETTSIAQEVSGKRAAMKVEGGKEEKKTEGE